MIARLGRAAVLRLLAGLGLARKADIEGARRAVRASERERANRLAAKAASRLEALNRKFRDAQQRAAAEEAMHTTLRGLLRHYLIRLARTETELADHFTLERRVQRAQLASGVKAAKRDGVSPAAAAAAARFEAQSAGYSRAAARWRSGEMATLVQRVTIGGLRWSVPRDPGHATAGTESGERWLPMDDLATVRRFAVGRVMLDIGAGVGATAIPRVVLGDFSKAYAAEPDDLAYLCLVGNTLDNHLEGRVLPEQIAIAGAAGTIRLRHPDGREYRVPAVTLEAWVQRLGVAPVDVRFVRVRLHQWNLDVLKGAATLLAQPQIVWQLELAPSQLRDADEGLTALSHGIAGRFTHIKEIGRLWTTHRPAGDVATVLRQRRDEGGPVNLLLFNLGGGTPRKRSGEKTADQAHEDTAPLISLLHATARLPAGWKPAMQAFLARARNPQSIEYILAVNEDEAFTLPVGELLRWNRAVLVQQGVTGPSTAYNAAARAARANVLMQIADDYFPPDGWDEGILASIPDPNEEVVLDVDNSDGSTKLLPFSILTRTYYERYGYVFYPGYHGLFADYEFTEQARRDGVVRAARHIVFEHRHPDRGLAPMDEIYARQKSHFAEGRRLFKERKSKGFPKWPA